VVVSLAWARPPRWAKSMGGSSREGRLTDGRLYRRLALATARAPDGRVPRRLRRSLDVTHLGWVTGQHERERAADAQPALTPDASPVGLDEATADVQTEPGATVRPGRRAVELPEAVEEAG